MNPELRTESPIETRDNEVFETIMKELAHLSLESQNKILSGVRLRLVEMREKRCAELQEELAYNQKMLESIK